MVADKARSVIDMSLPNESATQIRGFLGMAEFYRKFISDFAGITRPLNDLLKKGINIAKSWNQEHSDAVAKFKNAMITYPALRQYDSSRGIATTQSVHAIFQRYDERRPSVGDGLFDEHRTSSRVENVGWSDARGSHR